MSKTKVLFVCTMAKYRSRTAKDCLTGLETRCAGTDSEAEIPLSQELLDWADVIVCMEKSHRNKIRRKYKGYSSKIQVWGIPDIYGYMEDDLVHLCRMKAKRLLGE